MNNNMLEQMEIIEKGKCTGCGLCSQVCPVNAIKLCPDTVTGFLYPQIDRSICINCELCKKNCPQMRINCSQENFEKQVYGVVVKDEITRMNSTSGGIFSLLAQSILKDGMGVVVGAAYDKELYVQHIMVHNEEKLPQITRSKYLQSNLCSIYEEIKETLKSGKKVLFSGTPCQVSAIKRFCELNGVIEGLYLVDLLCRGIPSPKANQLYLEQIAKERGSRVVAQYHKDKTYGWRSLATKYELENGTSFVERIEDSDWGKSFICYDYCTRESCFSCSYKKEERVSDITLGDFWGVNDPELDDNRGTSAVFVNTQKGSWLFSNIIQDIIYKSFTFQDVANEKNKGAFSPLRDNKLERILFWELLKTNDYRTTVKLVREREVLEDDLQRKAKEFEFQSIRNKKKFDIVCKWMQLKQHNISIMSYLKERNMMSVAIYGAGELGILLYKELSCESDYVKYILDKNAQEMPLQDKSVPVYSVEDMKVTPVDLVIVTPVFVIDEVKGLILERFPKQKVLELEEVLSEMSNIL